MLPLLINNLLTGIHSLDQLSAIIGIPPEAMRPAYRQFVDQIQSATNVIKSEMKKLNPNDVIESKHLEAAEAYLELVQIMTDLGLFDLE